MQEKMLESLLNKILLRVEPVARLVPPLEIRRSARRGGSQLETCLRACWAVLCAGGLLLQVH